MNEWVCSIGGMILTGETEVLGEKHYTAWVVDEWMSMALWWNDTDRGNWSAGRKNYTAWVVDEWMSMERWWIDTDRGHWRILLQFHSLRHKCHFYCPGIDPELLQWMIGMFGRKLWHGQSMKSLSNDASNFFAYLTLSMLLLQYKDQAFNGVQVNNCCLLGWS